MGKHTLSSRLAENVLGGREFRHYMCQVEERPDHEDPDYGDGHGTHVIGTIAAVDNETAAAINWAVDNGAHIISISLGWPANHTKLYEACKNAYNQGALLIAAAGNENGSVCYPVAYDSVVAVGAVYPNDTRWEWSNFGPGLEFVSPGFDIYSTHLNEGYALMSGTSMAVPHITAVAAFDLVFKN